MRRGVRWARPRGVEGGYRDERGLCLVWFVRVIAGGLEFCKSSLSNLIRILLICMSVFRCGIRNDFGQFRIATAGRANRLTKPRLNSHNIISKRPFDSEYVCQTHNIQINPHPTLDLRECIRQPTLIIETSSASYSCDTSAITRRPNNSFGKP